jgi:excisionase family DNA binding protein
MENSSEFVTVNDLAKELKVSSRTIQRMVLKKELPALRVGCHWRLRREWIEEWLKSNTINLPKEDSD